MAHTCAPQCPIPLCLTCTAESGVNAQRTLPERDIADTGRCCAQRICIRKEGSTMLNACLCLISTVHTGSQDAQKTSPYLEWRAPCSIKCALVSDIGVLIEDCCCEREQGLTDQRCLWSSRRSLAFSAPTTESFIRISTSCSRPAAFRPTAKHVV